MAKKPNPQDSTLRNVRAAKLRNSRVQAQIRELDTLLAALQERVDALENGTSARKAK